MSAFVNKVVIVVFCLWMADVGLATAGEVRWTRSPETAVEQANASGRLILVSVGANWCHYCKKMDKDTWSNHEIAAVVADEYVPLKLSDEEHRELIETMGIQGYPVTLIFTPDRRLVARLDGYVGPEKMADAMTRIRTAVRASKTSASNAQAELR